jgi:hypothetical protein
MPNHGLAKKLLKIGFALLGTVWAAFKKGAFKNKKICISAYLWIRYRNGLNAFIK